MYSSTYIQREFMPRINSALSLALIYTVMGFNKPDVRVRLVSRRMEMSDVNPSDSLDACELVKIPDSLKVAQFAATSTNTNIYTYIEFQVLPIVY